MTVAAVALHPAVEERLSRLAPDQRAAATSPPGPVLCVAPAGSGKTTTLVARVCWLVATGADPSAITAVTFNKRAADELGDRLRTALEPLGEKSAAPRVKTFHALGREILAEAGVPVRNLVDRSQVLRRLNRDQALPPSMLRRLDDAFSRLKLDLGADAGSALAHAGTTPGLDTQAVAAFVEYERWLADNDALDFDDLVRRALAVLREQPATLAAWRRRCASLLVDEVQDVDRSQLELAVLLAGDQRNVFLVGDDDQTIYAWRLADVRRVLDLAASLPGLRRVDLVTNYRCPRQVVDRAVRLIERNAERFAKTIQAGPLADGELFLLPDSGDELSRARRLLAEWYLRDGDTGTYAVLARTNAELAPFAALALEVGISYRAADDGLLLDEPSLDDLLAELPNDVRPSVALARSGRRSRLAPSLIGWSLPYSTAADLRLAVGETRARRAELRRDDAQLVLATAHGTKGLEFDHVAVIGMDDNVFPSRRTIEEHEDPVRALEEERRLAYVAWTRARRSLVLVYDPAAPSLFLREAFSVAELRAAP
ncbi:MAG TPA: ATP-dependent helicase [Candidatus Limnocylindrales bacterium]|nr:ATP-dependent helicase [Candidatus Limnocylindrales bacterium]